MKEDFSWICGKKKWKKNKNNTKKRKVVENNYKLRHIYE